MSTKKKCINCGLLIDNDMHKCPYCGYDQNNTSDVPIEEATSFADIVEEKKDDSQPKKEPKINKRQQLHFVKQILFFLIGFGGIQILYTVLEVFFGIFFPGKFTTSALLMLLNSVVYGVGFIVMFIIANKDLKIILSGFLKGRTYLLGIFYGFILIVGTIIISTIGSLIYENSGDNVNEFVIVSMTASYPVASIVFLAIIGPVVEEFTYRLGFFAFFEKKSKVLAYILTAIFFGLIHANFFGEGVDIINELVQLPNYMFAGLLFSFVYEKEGVETSIVAHVFNNVVSILLTIMTANA